MPDSPLDKTLIFAALEPTERAALRERAEQRHVPAGAMVFQEGNPADTMCVLLSGKCMLSQDMQPHHEAQRGEWLDPLATLGELPHALTAIAIADCEVLCWSVADLWQVDSFARAARQYLASTLLNNQSRLDELETPVHYAGSADIQPGPFTFEGMTMLIALCDADLNAIQALLPDGLSLLRRPGRGRGSIFLALARFPNAYPDDRPHAWFGYDETTCFVPVRFGSNLGLFVPYIYPSTWEPILLGREIYGFPKRLGKTIFTRQSAALTVDGTPNFRLLWQGLQSTSEPRLIRAVSDWVGIEGHVTEAAFRAGEVLRQTLRLPGYRRIDVYNHKRVLAVNATTEKPRYAVDCLTRAVFGVLRWQRIEQMQQPELTVTGGPLVEANLHLREAYYTQLDMHLSKGEVVRDFSS